MNPLNSILGTIISGFVLALIIVFALGGFTVGFATVGALKFRFER